MGLMFRDMSVGLCRRRAYDLTLSQPNPTYLCTLR
jgi:hypothetical protein